MNLRAMFASPEMADHQIRQRQRLYEILDNETEEQITVRFLLHSELMEKLGRLSDSGAGLEATASYQAVCLGLQFLADYLEKRFRNERKSQGP